MENYAEINYENNMQMLNDALAYTRINYSHEDIIEVLKSDNDLEKQYCLMILEKINSKTEAKILVPNLINHSGPVREACAYKISEFIKQTDFAHCFQLPEIIDIFVKSIVDINPSVSRCAVEIINYIEDVDYLYNKILSEVNSAVSDSEKMTENRSYDTNKINFKIYWYLESLIVLCPKISDNDVLFGILDKTSKSNDYPIREKTAKLVSLLSVRFSKYSRITDILKNDENFYVRKAI